MARWRISRPCRSNDIRMELADKVRASAWRDWLVHQLAREVGLAMLSTALQSVEDSSPYMSPIHVLNWHNTDLLISGPGR